LPIFILAYLPEDEPTVEDVIVEEAVIALKLNELAVNVSVILPLLPLILVKLPLLPLILPVSIPKMFVAVNLLYFPELPVI
jgi:hypothetical protein